jgi:hypothetical protein
MKEVDAANIILGEAGDGEQFKLRWGWLRFRLSIKPVSTKTLIRISREVAEIPEIDPSGDAFQEMCRNAAYLKQISRAIAFAANTPFIRIVAEAIRGLPLKHLKTLWATVIQQSDPSSFFFIMISARGVNKLKKMEPDER